jgi:hypothetical protein
MRTRLMAALVCLVALGATASGAPATAAPTRPLPPLDIQIVMVTAYGIGVVVVCPDDPPEFLTVYTTGATAGVPAAPLGTVSGFTCRRSRPRWLSVPLAPGVRLRAGQYLGEVGTTLSGDSGEMNNLFEDVVVGRRVGPGTLL